MHQPDFESKDGKVLNLDYIIESSLRDTNFVISLLKMFNKKAPEFRVEVKELIEQKQYKSVRDLVHKFKSSVSILGARVIFDALQEIENLSEVDIASPKLFQLLSHVEVLTFEAEKEVEYFIANPHELEE